VASAGATPSVSYRHDGPRVARTVVVSEGELAAHAAFLARLTEPLWHAP